VTGSATTDTRSTTSVDYEILARLAEGGMAEIFLARARGMSGLERYVVLKRIRPERGTDPNWIEMFLDEAKLAAQLQHPNIAQVFDLGRIGDAYFFTMEYVHGENVRDLLRRTAALGDRVPLPVALSIAVAAANGLEHAHQRCGHDGRPLGIVHRDVTPSNLMVSYEGVVKVVDFGVAKANLRGSRETRSGTVKGKIAYLSPEQCIGKGVVDHRSDVFSLGIVLWEMVTTTRLYARDSDFESMNAIVNHDAPLASSVRGDVPPELDRLIGKALCRDPGSRFQTCAEMVDALEQVASAIPINLSSSTLRRHLRELFGTRPEPWRELAVDDKVTTTVTNADGIESIPTALEEPMVSAPKQSARVTLPWFAADVEGAKVPLLATLRMQGPIVVPVPEAAPISPASTAQTMDVRRGRGASGVSVMAATPVAAAPTSPAAAESSLRVPAGKRSAAVVLAIMVAVLGGIAGVIVVVVAFSNDGKGAASVAPAPQAPPPTTRPQPPPVTSTQPTTTEPTTPTTPVATPTPPAQTSAGADTPPRKSKKSRRSRRDQVEDPFSIRKGRDDGLIEPKPFDQPKPTEKPAEKKCTDPWDCPF
jgi:serine/threonine-protein kinase